MLERLVVPGRLRLRGTTRAGRDRLVTRLRRGFWPDTAGDAVGVPLADHHVSVELLQMHYVTVHVIYGLLDGGEVVDHQLEVLVKIVDLAVDQVHAVLQVRFEGCPLDHLGNMINFAVFPERYYLAIELLKLLFELLMPRRHFFSDYLVDLEIIRGAALRKIQFLDFFFADLLRVGGARRTEKNTPCQRVTRCLSASRSCWMR